MSRQEFIDAHFHELCGIVFDAAMNARSGAELSMFLRNVQRRVADRLGKVYDDMKETKPAANGAPATPSRKATT